MDIKNSRILITGGSSGIGRSCAKLLSQKGAKLLLTGRNEIRLKAISEELGADYIVVGRPITQADDPKDAAERIVREL